MTRIVQHADGLGLFGTAQVGPVPVRTPDVLWSVAPGGPEPPGPLHLESGRVPSSPPRREVRWRSAEAVLSLDLPILAPEVSGQAPRSEWVGPSALYVHWPLHAAELATAPERAPELLILGNARALFASGAPFVSALRGLRERFGAEPVLWAPRVALPHRVAFLAYLGIDLVDSTEALWQVRQGRWLDRDLGVLDAEPPLAGCGCSGCLRGGAEKAAGHALAQLEGARARASSAAALGRLRELVEAQLVAEPSLAELLRYTDRDLGEPLAQRQAVVGRGIRPYVLRESLRRPEVRRFRQRLIERYRPPPSKEVLLLVPCSRTKPYRASPSHRRLSTALEGLAHPERVHVVSVTSPLGLVPRELEDVYPARHYDIPVTGDWDEEERGAVTAALHHLVRVAGYRRAVAHLDPKEYDFIRAAWPAQLPVEWSCPDDRTGSPEAIAALRQGLERADGELTAVSGGPLTVVREGLREVAAMQFGRAAAEQLFASPARLMGRPWFQRLVDGQGTDLATWREERGLLQLTVAGAARFASPRPLEVEVQPDVALAGDLFVPGVARADPGISPGDAVVLAREGELLAVGEAALSGRLMKELRRGLAVRVRHRRHASAPAPTGP